MLDLQNKDLIIEVAKSKGLRLPKYYKSFNKVEYLTDADIEVKYYKKNNDYVIYISYPSSRIGMSTEFLLKYSDVLSYKQKLRENKINNILNK